MPTNTKKVAFVNKLLPLILFSWIIVSCSKIDHFYSSMSIDQAEELLPFDICFPTNLPENLQNPNSVEFRKQYGDPSELQINVELVDQASEERIVTINQRFAPGRLSEYDDNEKINERVFLRDLIAWSENWEQVDALVTQTENSYEIILDDEVGAYRIITITEPDYLRSTIIFWSRDNVAYKVYSSLSAESTLSIAKSIPGCNN